MLSRAATGALELRPALRSRHARQPTNVACLKKHQTLTTVFARLPAGDSKCNASRIGGEAGLPAEEKWPESDLSQLELGRAAYEAAMAATAACKSFRERLDMYLLAAEAGHAEARVRYE